MDIVYCVVIGAVFGSFLSMLVYRFSKQKSLKIVRSYCPYCNHTLLWKDLIPLVSWISLKGKCRYCKHKISIMYPLNELACGIIFSALYMHMQKVNITILYALYLFLMLLMSEVDVYRKEIPLIMIVLLYVLCIPSCLISDMALKTRLLGMFILTLPMFMVYIFSKNCIGFGDILVLGAIGLLFGVVNGLWIMIYTYLFAGCYVLLLLAFHKANRKSEIAMLPFFFVGSVIFIFVGFPILS